VNVDERGENEMPRYNLNNTDRQRDFSPVPPGIYRVRAKIKPGGVGESGLLVLAKNRRTMALNLELTIISGEHDNRRVWDYVIVFVDESNGAAAPPGDPDQIRRYRTAVQMGLSRLRAMLESHHEIASNDKSEEASKIRQVDSLQAFDGLTYWVRLAIKHSEQYGDRNSVVSIITPDAWDWPGGANNHQAAPARPLREELDDEIPF
jgi:hypothetical protein